MHTSHRTTAHFPSVPTMLAGLLVFVFFFPKPAYAYLDPGTGSYVFQMLLAGILGFAVTIGTYWQKIFTYFTKKRESTDEEDTAKPRSA